MVLLVELGFDILAVVVGITALESPPRAKPDRKNDGFKVQKSHLRPWLCYLAHVKKRDHLLYPDQ